MNNTRSHRALSLAAVLRAVRECRAKPLGDPQRIIVLLAPAGFDLPLLCRRALRRRGAVLLQAGQLDHNRLRFLKLLAHRTRVAPVLLAGDGIWRAWNRRRPLEAAQIRRRTHAIVQLNELCPQNT
jgi:hypothetical protein